MQLRYTIPILSVFSVCLFVLGQGGLVNPTLSSNGGGSSTGGTNISSGFALTNRPTASGIPAGQSTIFTWSDFSANTLSLSNIVAGKTYDDGSKYSVPAYEINAPIGSVFGVMLTNAAAGTDQGVANNDFSGGVQNGLFTNTTSPFIVFSLGAPNSPILSLVYNSSTNPITANNFIGNLIGNVNGNIIGSVLGTNVVPDIALNPNVQLKNTNIFIVVNGGIEHIIAATNTANGSTLSLFKVGTNGYVDINFNTVGNLGGVPGSPLLHFAIGRSIDPSVGVYTNNYIELVDQDNFFFLINGTIYGGVKGHTGNFIWYQNGTTNTPMFEVNRSSNFVMVTNLIVGNETNIASFTLVNTNWISGQLYTNQTGRPIQVIMPCKLTMTGVAGNATFALVVTGVTTNALSMSTLVTSLATSLTNQVSAWVAANGTFTGTNLSSGAGDSGGPVNGGQYMVY